MARPAGSVALNRFVVTGSGHSGTAWLALALSYLGVPTTHEGVFRLDGPVGWPDRLQADVSFAAMPYLRDEGTPPGVIVVRDPLAVLNSFWRGRNFAKVCPCHEPGAHVGSPFVRFLVAHGFDLDAADELGLTIRHVAGWVERGLRFAPYVRLEDPEALAEIAADYADVPLGVTERLLAGPWLPPFVNSHGVSGGERPWVTWAEVDDHPDGWLLRRQAEQFGYL